LERNPNSRNPTMSSKLGNRACIDVYLPSVRSDLNLRFATLVLLQILLMKFSLYRWKSKAIEATQG
ncbi:hypothetical protein ACR2WG_26885, partial [Klebsiella pneumoniae]